jgi:uncharacterized Tic20 family protein
MNIASELEKLQQLRQSGAIDEYEFGLAKAKLLSGAPDGQTEKAAAVDSVWAGPSSEEKETRKWGALLHFSILAGHVVPLAGLVVPIAIWQLKKIDLPGIDAHGKNAVNWIISLIIYIAISIVLVFIVIGIPILVVLGALSLIFPIVGGIKAANGEVWKYPMAISFLK